jgi:Bacteriodetes cell division protein (FtsL-like)
MAQNVSKNKKKTVAKKPKSESKILGWLGDSLNLEKKIGKEFPVRYIDRAGFLFVMGLILIAFRLNAERQMRQMRKLTTEIHQLQAAYTIRKAHYMKSGKQSELAPKLAALGLVESKQAPYRIVVKEDEK